MPDEPFSALSFIGGPALLTNAISVLLMSTANRLARSVDRARDLADKIVGEEKERRPASDHLIWRLDLAERRVLIIMRAMTVLYLGLGSFATATLLALIGVFARPSTESALLDLMVGATLVTGILGFVALVSGAVLMVHESHLTYRLLRDEADRVRALSRTLTPPPIQS